MIGGNGGNISEAELGAQFRSPYCVMKYCWAEGIDASQKLKCKKWIASCDK